MERFINYERSKYPMKDVVDNFEKISEAEFYKVFKTVIEDLSFFMIGEEIDGEFHVQEKNFKNADNELHSYLKNSPKVYAVAFYGSDGKLNLLNNYHKDTIDSFMTSAPAYEFYVDGEVERLWYVKGDNRTHLVRQFCDKNEIDIKNISNNELELILMNLTKEK